jgi:hypothetical protein
MIDTLSTEMSDIITIDSKMEDHQIGLELTSMISCIVQQCSKKIFHVGLPMKIFFISSISILDGSRKANEFSCNLFFLS